MPILDRPIRFAPISEFPGTRREFNFIMPESTPVATLTTLVKNAHNWISDISVAEIYRDEKHIGQDKKSVVISLLIRNPETTITDEEALKVQEALVQDLAKVGYLLRS